MLISQQQGHHGNPSHGQFAQAKRNYQRHQQSQHEQVQGAGNNERVGNTHRLRNRIQRIGTIKFNVLAGIENVKASYPEGDGGGKQQNAWIKDPRIAIHAAAGAMPSANPSTRCDQRVNRLV